MTAPNYHHILRGQYLVLVSYRTPVAALNQKTGELLVTSRKYSVTTTRHISKFRKFCKYPTAIAVVDQSIIDNIERGLA